MKLQRVYVHRFTMMDRDSLKPINTSYTMKNMLRLLLFTLFIVAAVATSFAQAPAKKTTPVRFLVRGALELGGDDVAEVYFTNGNSQTVKAGQGGTIAVGAQLQVPGVEKLLIHGTIGYKYLTTAADNAHIRLGRVPIQFTAHWLALPKLRVGGGLAMHTGIRFNADGVGPNLEFNAASGPMFEVAYNGIGLSYTAMKYTDQYKKTYGANAVGLSYTLAIPGS